MKQPPISPVGELAFLRNLRARPGRFGASTGVRVGIGDDAAVLRPKNGQEVVVTTDFSLENRHFRRGWGPAEAAGHRCLARGLSDLAAMGATPLGAFLSLALPAGTLRRAAGRRWIDGFLSGLLALAASTGAPLAGGDTATAPGEAILADIVLLGSVPRGQALLRSGARVGDGLYVTGALGGSAAELAAIATAPKKFARAAVGDAHPHLFPQPRLAAGVALRRLATAAMDLSDGLSTDLHRLCEESGVGAVVDANLLPMHSLLEGTSAAGQLDLALNGGEDYELLFTAKATTRIPKRFGGVAVTRIGEIVSERRGVMLLNGKSKAPLQPRGWEHAL